MDLKVSILSIEKLRQIFASNEKHLQFLNGNQATIRKFPLGILYHGDSVTRSFLLKCVRICV